MNNILKMLDSGIEQLQRDNSIAEWRIKELERENTALKTQINDLSGETQNPKRLGEEGATT